MNQYATIQNSPPTMAQIVREATDDGRRIVEFYLGVAEGTIAGFRDHHRAAAARRLDKIAPGLVAEYLVKYAPAHLRDSYRGMRSPVGTTSPMNQETPANDAPRRSSPFRRRLAQLVREETGDGRAIVDFMTGVMHGTLTAFKPCHRLEAATELAAHITHDELNPTPTATNDNTPDVGADPRVRPLSTEPDSTVVPAPNTVDEPTKSSRPEPVLSAVEGPAEAQRSAEPPQLKTKNQKLTTNNNFPPISIEEIMNAGYLPRHITSFKFARDQITGSVYAFDELGPFIVDEDGDEAFHISPDRIAGYGNVPYQTFESEEETPPRRRMTRKQRRQRGNARALVTGRPSGRSPPS